MTSSNWLEKECDALEDRLNKNSSIAINETKLSALNKFREYGLPTTKNEDWKYTDLSHLISHQFCNNSPSKNICDLHIDKSIIEPFLIPKLNVELVVFVDGSYCDNLSSKTIEKNNISVFDSSNAPNDKIKAQLNETVLVNTPKPFSLLNTAFLQNGLCIDIGKNTETKKPLHVIYFASEASNDIALYPRLLLNVEENSSITLIESFVGTNDASYFSCGVLQINIGNNSKVNHLRMGLHGNKAICVSSCDIKQSKDSRYNLHFLSTGGLLVRNEVYNYLAGDNAESNLLGLTIANNNEFIDNLTFVEHLAPNSTSYEKFKGIYDSKAHGVFTGTIVVQKEAKKTNAYQSNSNLLLSKEAKVETRPQLKIWTDDVKCSHGTTTGQLNKDALFYLTARGIDKDTATRLLTEAFANEILLTIESQEIRDYVAAQFISTKLGSNSKNDAISLKRQL